MPVPEPAWRRDLHEHTIDRFAHGEAWEDRRRYVDAGFDVVRVRLMELEQRMTKLEQFRWFMAGGMATISVLSAAGGLTLLFHLAGKG